MSATHLPTRRGAVLGIATSALAAVLPRPTVAQAVPRVVVIGGGFGGASCARALKRIDPKIAVTLVVQDRQFVACPFSNEVIAGLRGLEAQTFGYDKIASDGVTLAVSAASKVDATSRVVTLAEGSRLQYDRLV